MKTQRHNSWSV